MNIYNTYSLYDPCLKGSKYWINYFIKKGANDWDSGFLGACLSRHKDIVNLMIEKGATGWNSGLQEAYKDGQLRNYPKYKIPKYKISFKIPKDDQIIKIIYASLYDYLPDEMIDIVLKYSIVEDFNLYLFLNTS